MLTHQNRPEVEFDLHLGRDPQNRDSELFLLDRLARANHHFPRIVHGVDQHRHFSRPRRPLGRRRPLLDQGRKLFRCSFGLPHIGLRKAAFGIVVQNPRRGASAIGSIAQVRMNQRRAKRFHTLRSGRPILVKRVGWRATLAMLSGRSHRRGRLPTWLLRGTPTKQASKSQKNRPEGRSKSGEDARP
jgi:hypothetical protein